MSRKQARSATDERWHQRDPPTPPPGRTLRNVLMAAQSRQTGGLAPVGDVAALAAHR